MGVISPGFESEDEMVYKGFRREIYRINRNIYILTRAWRYRFLHSAAATTRSYLEYRHRLSWPLRQSVKKKDGAQRWDTEGPNDPADR
jgi:hypothetical protein